MIWTRFKTIGLKFSLLCTKQLLYMVIGHHENCFYCILYAEPPLWPSDQSSCLQKQRSRFDSRLYQIFWEVVGLERGPLSLVSTIEELLGRKCSGYGLESREHGRREPSLWPRGNLYPQKLALTSPISGGRSVGIVRLLTQATEFNLVFSTQTLLWCIVKWLILCTIIVIPG
jgi:hypothetical protein